jgi:putative RNA 2'-phosphotransferase
MRKELTSVSKFLSLVLRHQPQTIGIELDSEGWVDVDELLAGCGRHGRQITLEQLQEVVDTNEKRRFAISADGRRIRANQGHSLEVDLGLAPVEPPQWLYHGTVAKFLDSIRRQGLLKGNRQHVHLSADHETAQRVGQRRGQPVVLLVEAERMARAGHFFYRSENGVWLVDAVPAEYLQVPVE